MPEKLGGGGNIQENYDPNTGKYATDGIPNKYYDNPEEKALNSIGLSSEEIPSNIKEYKIPNLDSSDPYVIRDIRRLSFDKLIDNKTREYRYREWLSNSNNDYKKYIYNDLKSEKKEAALNLWYNVTKLREGKYDMSFEEFLSTPIKLYRATNIGEKENFNNPFFSYSPLKSDAERFLQSSQSLYLNRTGEIEELEIKPIDTLGMLPGDELEIVVPNKNYESLTNITKEILEKAKQQNVSLPYNEEQILEMFQESQTIKEVNQFKKVIEDYIRRKSGGV